MLRSSFAELPMSQDVSMRESRRCHLQQYIRKLTRTCLVLRVWLLLQRVSSTAPPRLRPG